MKEQRRRLRSLLAQPEIILAPGAFDCLSARLIEQAGFPAAYMTGFGAAASYLGAPDVGLMTLTEMVSQARRLATMLSIPLIADADTGYGNPLNVTRTVREYEAAGVAALHIEDQEFPKRCGHMEGKRVIPPEAMVQKVRAAVAARTDPDLVIIARTDAHAVEGLESALDRAQAYAEAGAEVLFVEGPQTRQEVKTIATRLRGTPLLFNYSASGKVPPMAVPELEALGFKIVIFPTHALFRTTYALQELLATLKATGSVDPYHSQMVSFDAFNDLIGLPAVQKLEREFGARPESLTEDLLGLGKELWREAGGADRYLAEERQDWR